MKPGHGHICEARMMKCVAFPAKRCTKVHEFHTDKDSFYMELVFSLPDTPMTTHLHTHTWALTQESHHQSRCRITQVKADTSLHGWLSCAICRPQKNGQTLSGASAAVGGKTFCPYEEKMCCLSLPVCLFVCQYCVRQREKVSFLYHHWNLQQRFVFPKTLTVQIGMF